nr:hypothetical protein [Nocardioides convexus]
MLVEAHRTGAPFPLTGVDYPTRDGSGIRDYVHVWDLARAHVAAVEGFDRALAGGRTQAINLGTGRGTTVREPGRRLRAGHRLPGPGPRGAPPPRRHGGRLDPQRPRRPAARLACRARRPRRRRRHPRLVRRPRRDPPRSRRLAGINRPRWLHQWGGRAPPDPPETP